MKRETKQREQEYEILKALALNDASTPYAISEKSDIAKSTVVNIIRRLESDGRIKLEERYKCRTGLDAKRYFLTIKGLVDYAKLNPRFSGKEYKLCDDIDDAVKTFSKHYPHGVFKIWDEITNDAAFGRRTCCNAFTASCICISDLRSYNARAKSTANLMLYESVNIQTIDQLTNLFLKLLADTFKLKQSKQKRTPAKPALTDSIKQVLKTSLDRELQGIEKYRTDLLTLASFYSIET